MDVQPIFISAIQRGEQVLQRCSFAVAAAAGLGIDVAFTEQMPGKLGGTVKSLLQLVEQPSVWGKASFSALADDGIREELRKRDVDHLLLCGIETPICIYQTALAALDEQYQVTVLVDAVGARRGEDAAMALSALQHAGITILPAETVFYALLRDAKHPFFKAFTKLVKKYG